VGLPQNRVAQFVHFVNQDNEIMAEHLAQRFVDHRHVRLTAKPVSKLALYHGERRFNIAPLVVVLQELRPLELEVVIHLLPRSTAVAAMMRGEGNEWRSTNLSNRVRVALAGVSLVGGDFGHLEISGGSFNHRWEQRRIIGVPVVNLYSGNDICFGATYDVALYPVVGMMCTRYVPVPACEGTIQMPAFWRIVLVAASSRPRCCLPSMIFAPLIPFINSLLSILPLGTY